MFTMTYRRVCTELDTKVVLDCVNLPRPGGGITQPRTTFFGQLCRSFIICWLAPRDPERSLDPFQILESNHAVLAIMYL